jgi:DNA-binding CsgD family transcriptional regulator/PAS domain-containing protein
MATPGPKRLSHLIGTIYDCAIKPEHWPHTIAEICETIGCLSGVIMLIDLHRSQHRLAHAWGMAPGWERRFLSHSDTLTGFYAKAFSKSICLDGEPLVLSSVISGRRARSIYAELTQPEGIADAMQTVVLRQAGRLAVFGANRHNNMGALTNHERTIMRLLAPHIRRAVIISDILDMRKLEAHALAATLDSFTAGVVVVADQGRILHANNAARSMFSAAGPVSGAGGFLKARDDGANRELANAIVLARANEATIGTAGIGVSLKSSSEEPSIAHVLPLAYGDLRARLMPSATAAVVVTQLGGQPATEIGAIAKSFGLTPAEARTLEHLAGGATIAQTADAIGISTNTTRTHLARIFSKTGTSRQADLIALVNQLMPPFRRPGSS